MHRVAMRRPGIEAPLFGLAAVAFLASTRICSAQAFDVENVDQLLSPADVLYLALLAIVVGASMLSAVFLMRQRAQMAAENDSLRADLSEARTLAEARTLLLSAGDERLLVYSGSGNPECFGTLSKESGAPTEEKRFLAFSDWMGADMAERLNRSIGRLRGDAETFHLEIDRPEGAIVEVSGKTIGGFAAVRFVFLKGIRTELREVELNRRAAIDTIETLQNLFDASPIPFWLRDGQGRLTWINGAYARAVEVGTIEEGLENQAEFLSETDRAEIVRTIGEKGSFSGRLSTVVEADRRKFAVVEASGPFGRAGLASDVTETEQVRMELRQTIDSQSDTLDQLTTAVARFDERTRLVYYNAALQRLFDLTNTYLETEPDHLALLDHLRTTGILPLENRLRSELQNQDLAAYRATEPTETLWHLSDGRTLRVIASPQPRGGATWIFEDISEKLELETQVRSTVQLQRETIDSLKEGVAVFAGDGRLRLSNPSFADLFGLDADFLASRPRIQMLPDLATVTMSPAGTTEEPLDRWQAFTQAITDFDERGREMELGETALSSGRIIAYAVVPLPNAQTMLTFSDISDARKAERMLIEKNEALEQANRIKNDFVQHVNYELRSPLTNIIGFSALLKSPDTGPLNERQNEYLEYIGSSTNSLLTIVNDILDLATVDAGIMELEVSDVDIAATVEHAVEAVRDRMEDARVKLSVDLSKAEGTFQADGHRLTQILFNLLSNAANFAPTGSTVDLTAERSEDSVSFTVTDHGPGIAADKIERMFERFEADPSGARQSGAGLGLSIVKSFVDLHHGTISIESEPDKGTAVVCTFPLHNLSPLDPSDGPRRSDLGGTRFRDAAE